MPKFTEDQLNNLRYPPSFTEEVKLAKAQQEIKNAITSSLILKEKKIKTFGQGSYANDTNVKNNSDVDINVCLEESVFVKLPENKTYEDLGYRDSSYKFSQYRKDVYDALVEYFGEESISDNSKCITIIPNSTRVEIDVVPTFKYIRYDSENSKVEGVKFISSDSETIINYPLAHIENGKNKNSNTQKRFKRLTRIYRNIRYKMLDDNIVVSDNITSFLLECLVFNVPDNIFNDHETWTERLKHSIIFLYNETKNETKCDNWGEVSELLFLFKSRKWSVKDVNSFLQQMWNYLGY